MSKCDRKLSNSDVARVDILTPEDLVKAKVIDKPNRPPIKPRMCNEPQFPLPQDSCIRIHI